MRGGSAKPPSGRKERSDRSISLSHCLLLLVTLELNEVLIAGVSSLQAEIIFFLIVLHG